MASSGGRKSGSDVVNCRIQMSVHKHVVRLTPEAESDYEQILLYTLRRWGESQTSVYRGKITDALERLQKQPFLGWSRDDLFVGCRAIRVDQHLIYYYQR